MNIQKPKFGASPFGLALLATLCLGLAGTANAGPISCPVGGGGLPTGWTLTTGSVGGGVAASAAPFIGPSGAATDCYIVTDSGAGVGTIPTTFLPSPGGVPGPGIPNIPNITNGSQMVSPVFTATAGQQLNFDFMFATNNGTANFSDWANAVLVPTGGGTALNLFTARTSSSNQVVPGFGFPALAPGLVLSPGVSTLKGDTWFLDPQTGGTSSADPNATQYGPTRFGGGPGGSSDWINALFTFDATNAGTYQLEMNVANVGDTIYSSALFFAGASISPTPVVTAAEPSTWLLMLSGLVGFGLFGALGRRNLSKKQGMAAAI